MFQLSIVTPEKIFCDLEVEALTVPGTEGYLGILAHHAPIITALKTGMIEYRTESREVSYVAVSEGFLEVSENKATILADSVEYASDIDVDRAKSAVSRAKDRIEASTGDADIDIDRARVALLRALNRLKVNRVVR